MAKELKPSDRGELEITDLNNMFILDDEGLNYSVANMNTWFDAGSIDSLLKAGLEARTNKRIDRFENNIGDAKCPVTS
jgi:glucose-1-phosphate thymidylyltransferase